MDSSPIEIYHHRAVTDHGVWSIGSVQFKMYGLLAPNKQITNDMVSTAHRFLKEDVLQRVHTMGESNGLGFAIIHPGDIGMSIAAHWWVQGSVLCQHIFRHQYGDVEPLDTIERPVIACVWELAVINAEQEAWRKMMMKSDPDRAAYLNLRTSMSAA